MSSVEQLRELAVPRRVPATWIEGSDIGKLETPCWIVDESVMEANLSRMQEAAVAAGVSLRPHIKTHKSPDLAKRQIALGAVGIATATTSEAEVMAAAGIEDIFVVYPPYDVDKRARLIRIALQGVRVGCTVESADVAIALGREAEASGVCIDVYIEVNIVDPTGASGRCGVRLAEAPELARQLASIEGILFRGIVGYRGIGWLYAREARSYGRSDLVEVAREEARMLASTADAIRKHGVEVESVVAGSTPTAFDVLQEPGITEIQPGEYIFYGGTHVGPGVASLDDCALSITATVISTPHPGRAIIDAGAKVLSGDIKPDDLPNLRMRGLGIVRDADTYARRDDLVLTSLSEEHGTIHYDADAAQLHIGDRLDIVPVHVCTSVNLAPALVLHRSRTCTSLLPVDARSHVW